MSKKFEALSKQMLVEALPNRMLDVEEFERFNEIESLEQVSPLSVIRGPRLVSSFVIVTKKSIYTLGFDEEEMHWTRIGTFERDEGATALRNTNQWLQNHYDNVTDDSVTEADFERVGNLLDSD